MYARFFIIGEFIWRQVACPGCPANDLDVSPRELLLFLNRTIEDPRRTWRRHHDPLALRELPSGRITARFRPPSIPIAHREGEVKSQRGGEKLRRSGDEQKVADFTL